MVISNLSSTILLPSLPLVEWQDTYTTLHYEAVRQAADPEAMLLTFLQSTYDTTASLSKWDRATLERA